MAHGFSGISQWPALAPGQKWQYDVAVEGHLLQAVRKQREKGAARNESAPFQFTSPLKDPADQALPLDMRLLGDVVDLDHNTVFFLLFI